MIRLKWQPFMGGRNLVLTVQIGNRMWSAILATRYYEEIWR